MFIVNMGVEGFWFVSDLVRVLRSYNKIVLGEEHSYSRGRVIAREFVKNLPEYTLAVEMLEPSFDVGSKSLSEVHEALVSQWGYEYPDYNTAVKQGYLSVMREARSVVGIGCVTDLRVFPNSQPYAVWDQIFSERDKRIKQNLSRIEGKVLAYVGTNHTLSLTDYVKVLLPTSSEGLRVIFPDP